MPSDGRRRRRNRSFRSLLWINPLFSYLEVFRGFMYRGEFAEWWAFVIMLGSALLVLVLGVWVFARSWRQMVGAL